MTGRLDRVAWQIASRSPEEEDGLADITRNLFYWFRGPTPRSDPGAHKQLENNLTKALISVLENGDRRLVLGPFLRELGLRPCQDIVFSLQRRPLLVGTTKRRLVLAITGGETEVVPNRSKIEEGRPDAWICSRDWTILIESKIGSKVTIGQLRKHARAAGWPTGTYRTACLSWHDLYRLHKDSARSIPQNDTVSRLLLENWLQYLEHQNMTEFEKLEAIDFDFFNLPPEERRSLLPHMKKRIRGFARLLAAAGPAKKIGNLYKQRRVDEWKFGEPSTAGPSSWFNLGGDPSPRTWHATVFFRPGGLDVSVLNSGNHLARKLCRLGLAVFRNLIEEAGKSGELCVSCRRAWYRDPDSAYKGQNISHTDDPLTIMPATLDPHGKDSCATLLKTMLERLLKDKRWRTELRVRQEIPRDKLLPLSWKKQVTILSKPLGQLHRILKLLLDV